MAKPKIIHKKNCQHCGSKDDLIKISKGKRKDGVPVQYYLCNKCNTERMKSWYHKSPENKIKMQIITMKSYAKRFGYQLTKL